MNVALVLPGSIWYAPYVRIYTKILDELKIKYSIISWNREGDDKAEGYQYNVLCAKGHYSAGWKAYKGYLKYIIKTIKEHNFDRIIVFGPQMTCLLSFYLLVHFRGRYMIDYRDLSIEQKPGLKQLFAIMLKNSCANVISSPGYKQYLPKANYVLSHNFDIDIVQDVLNREINKINHKQKNIIDVLTIGAIRDYGSNLEVVKALANNNNIRLRFVGKGDGAEQIKDYCEKNDINNVFFHGFYKKEEEPQFIEETDILNIYYPYIKTHNSALSNRFYNSLIYRKPMIVNKGTTQGNYTEEYNVGIVVENCDNLACTIDSYFKSFDYYNYCNCCNKLLSSFLDDYKVFKETVIKFVGR